MRTAQRADLDVNDCRDDGYTVFSKFARNSGANEIRRWWREDALWLHPSYGFFLDTDFVDCGGTQSGTDTHVRSSQGRPCSFSASLA